MPIQRQSCFKVKREDDLPKMFDAYNDLANTNERDGKPYIQKVAPHKTIATDSPMSQGYNFVVTTQFASLDDLRYYDTDCGAHKKLKATVIHFVDGPPLGLMSEV